MCSWWTLRSSKPLFWLTLEGGFDSHTLPQVIMSKNKFFNYIIKTLWIIIFFLIIFLDRENINMVVVTISILLITSFITILRALVSRNEWRKMIKDGDIEIQDKIKL